MKAVLDIFWEFRKDKSFIDSQFRISNGLKNICFVSPQLSGKGFYRYILPSIILFENQICNTALTYLHKFKLNEDITSELTTQQIQWADSLVFPFTTQQLGGIMKDGSESLYEIIKMINPDITIVFNVDYNYYQLPKTHPYHKKFTDPLIIKNVEDNIFYADITLTTNGKLHDVLLSAIKKQKDTRYKEEMTELQIGTIPMLTAKDVVMENISIETDPDRESRRKDQNKNNLRIGIICTSYNFDDLTSYRKQFDELQKKHGNKIQFIMMGFNGTDPLTGKSAFSKNFKFDFQKPCSIIHYPKMLYGQDLDVIFIPLKKTEYNETSENYIKFIEAGLLKIPIIAADIYPYNEILKERSIGYICKKKDDLLELIDKFVKDKTELRQIGVNAYNFVNDVLTFHQDNIELFANCFFYKTSIDEHN